MTVTRVFPLGHPVEIVSESDNLRGLWEEPGAMFDVTPLRFCVETMAKAEGGPLEFTATQQGFRFRCGSSHASFDLPTRSGTLRASEDGMLQLLEPLVLTALDWTFFIPIHGGCVVRDGKSVLLCGDSGAGKSTLAYACSRAGWQYVSDNALHWASEPYNLLVSGSPRVRLRESAKAMFSLADDPEIPGVTCAPAGPFVFLRRRPGPTVIRRFEPDGVYRYLAEYDTRPGRVYVDGELFRHGAWSMEYDDVWDGVRCLEGLL